MTSMNFKIVDELGYFLLKRTKKRIISISDVALVKIITNTKRARKVSQQWMHSRKVGFQYYFERHCSYKVWILLQEWINIKKTIQITFIVGKITFLSIYYNKFNAWLSDKVENCKTYNFDTRLARTTNHQTPDLLHFPAFSPWYTDK